MKKLLTDNYWDDFKPRVNETIISLNGEKKPSLKRLTVHLTEKCNFRCSYCNMNFNKECKTMDKNLAFSIVKQYADLNGSTIHFTGGEPTIVPYFEELCAYAKSLNLSVSSNTNAYILVDTTNIDKLKLSFDSCNAKEVNKLTGTKDSFNRVVKNIKIYSEKMIGKMLSITAVLDKTTYKKMLDLVIFSTKNFKVHNLYFSNYKGNNPLRTFTDKEIEDMYLFHIPQVLNHFKKHNETYSYKQLDLYAPSDFKHNPERFEQNKTIPCYIQLSEMTIDVDGSCHNCSHNFRDDYKPYKINVANLGLYESFISIKESLNNNYTLISKYCLSGCNCNLMGFNTAVHNKILL